MTKEHVQKKLAKLIEKVDKIGKKNKSKKPKGNGKDHASAYELTKHLISC